MIGLYSLIISLGISSLARDTDINFVGNKVVSDSELRSAAVDELTDLERRGATKALADDIAYTIETYYLSRGYAHAEVTYDYQEQGQQVRVDFNIREGPRVIIDKIRIRGNQFFDNSDLKSFLATKRGGLLGVGDRYFVRSDVDSGAAEIERAYIERGFLEVNVTEPDIRFKDNGKVDIYLGIEEGPWYRLRKIHLQGNQELTDKFLNERVLDLINRPFSPRTPFEIRAIFHEVYANRGFADIQIDVEKVKTPQREQVVLNVTLVEGPQVTIRKVFLVGNQHTDPDLLMSRMVLKEGDLYSRDKERTSFNRLFATGLFSSVIIELVGEADRRDLIVEVKELQSLEFSIMPGWGSYERARFELGFRERNLFGSGRTIRSNIEISTVGAAGLIGLTDPWLLGSGFTLDVPITYLRRREPSFTRSEIGIEVSLRRQWSSHFSTALGYQIKGSEALGDPDETDEFDEVFRIGSLRFEPRYDSRDDPFNPGSGLFLSLATDYAAPSFGSELNFFRTQLTWSQFFSISESSILALGVRSGLIVPVGSTNAIPIQERFFNGGEDSVRSFRQSELGPRDDFNEPLGGEARTILNLEWRQKITGSLQGAVFFDYGNVVADRNDYFEDFRTGIGTGLRYVLPIGALRLDIGWNPNTRSNEDEYNIHFSVGMAF